MTSSSFRKQRHYSGEVNNDYIILQINYSVNGLSNFIGISRIFGVMLQKHFGLFLSKHTIYNLCIIIIYVFIIIIIITIICCIILCNHMLCCVIILFIYLLLYYYYVLLLFLFLALSLY